MLKKDTPYYYRGKVKTPFQPFEKEFAIVFKEGPKKSKTKKSDTSLLEELTKKHKINLQKCGDNITGNGIYISNFPPRASKKRKFEICQSIDKENYFVSAPIIRWTESNASLLTNEIMVKFEDFVSEEEVEKIAKQFKLKIKRKISVLGNLYHFTTGQTATYEVLDLSNQIAELEDVIFAEPNLIHTVEDDAIAPTSFLFPEQWDHQILNTPDAWQFLRNINTNRTFGDSNVIIAVVDSGVDTNHPEFTGNVSSGSSKIYQAFDFSNMVANNNTLSSDHGTACASAAAALANNPSTVAGVNEGVAGVAGNCRVLAIRRGGNEARYADMYLWAAGFDPESDTEDFPAQINPGADIITSSFGFSTGSAISGTMSAVFDRLTDDGRNGRGTLLFFSAGNNTPNNPNGQDLDLTFYRPWGMYNRCFSVAASSLANDGTEQKTWYSCFGSVIDFCAPSSNAFVHNPPNGYGTFTATRVGNPEAKEVAVGRPTVQNSLSANVNSGSNTITVNNITGFAVGQAIMINNPGSNIAETHSITAINNATRQITLDANLFNNQLNGTNVFATQADYRNNFGGTSHATPLCAGVAALMLSANPQLTWTEVRDLMRDTAVKINPTESNSITTLSDSDGSVLGATNGRWQDINGNFSNEAAYDGNPVFSEFYGFGRIDAAAAVREAGWDIELVTTNLDFNDVPEGEQAARAIRFNVKSLWSANFNMIPPGAPFGTPLGTSTSIGTSTDSSLVREVYLWVTFTGTTAGDQITMADGRTVTVRNPETEQEWVIPITANTIERQTSAVMLALDQSGSMDFPSGIGSAKRIDVLRFSANILADVIQEGNGLGIVSFDQDPHDVLIPLVGPLGPVSPFDVDRTNIKAAISSFSPNLNGSTAIGDGIERAQQRLNPIGGYDSKSVIVLTDGKETDSQYIADVTDSINDRVFAIGLGKAENIEPAALSAVTNNNNGYLLLTDELDENSIFKLAKYFLQILAGVNNEDVVVDPDGVLFAGQEHRIPFVINEADISSDVILMLPNPQMIDFSLESPNGHIIKPSDSTTTPGLTFSYGSNVSFYRMTMPLPIGTGERDGKWHAILKLNEKYQQTYKHYEGYKKYPLAYKAVSESQATTTHRFRNGVPYSLLVHAYSNLKMRVDLTQTGFEPGDTIKLSVLLTQYGIPLTKDASVYTILKMPNGVEKTLHFQKSGAGTYQLDLSTEYSGVYQFRVIANGTSFRGRNFTREQVRTGAVWQGGNQPVPGSGRGGSEEQNGKRTREELCRLISCLASDKNLSREFKDRLRKNGIDVDGMLKCLKAFCQDNKDENLTSQLSSLKVHYATLLDVFNEIITEEG
ncbi:MAG: S8 family serine peptidase [Bacteroidota bacterium]